MDFKPSLRNVICTAQEYLTLVENCPPFAGYKNVSANADEIRRQITAYNAEVHEGKGRNPGQLAFEDFYAKGLMQCLNTSRQLTAEAAVHPELKKYVVDGGGSEWNRVNPEKLSNHLKALAGAEALGKTRSPSAYHCDGPMEYLPHGCQGVLKMKNPDQTTSAVNLSTVTSSVLAAKASRFGG